MALDGQRPFTAIRIDDLAGNITLTGHAYWSLIFSFIVFLFLLFEFESTFIGVLIFVVGISLVIQRSHYAKLAQIIEEVVAKG